MTNTNSSSIDLIFTSNISATTEFSFENSFVQTGTTIALFFGKMNLNVPLPLPNTPEVWDYNNNDKKNIQKNIKHLTEQDCS